MLDLWLQEAYELLGDPENEQSNGSLSSFLYITAVEGQEFYKNTVEERTFCYGFRKAVSELVTFKKRPAKMGRNLCAKRRGRR